MLWNSSQTGNTLSETAGLGSEALVSKGTERVVFNNQSLNIKFCLLIPVLFFAASNFQTVVKHLASPRKYAQKITWLIYV